MGPIQQPGANPAVAPARRRLRIVLAAAGLALICGIATTLFLIHRDRTGADAIAAAADRLFDQSAVAVDVAYSDPTASRSAAASPSTTT